MLTEALTDSSSDGSFLPELEYEFVGTGEDSLSFNGRKWLIDHFL